MDDKEKEKLEQELMFLKESFDTEVITNEEYEKAKERIERNLKEIGRKNSSKSRKKEKAEAVKKEGIQEAPKETKEDIVAIPEPKKEIEIITEPKEEKKEEQKEQQALESPVIVNIPKPAKEEIKQEIKVEEPEKEPEEDIKAGKWIWILLIIAIIGGIYYFYFTGSAAEGIAQGNGFAANLENVNSKVMVISSGKCFNCDTERVKSIIRAWFPGIKVEEINYDSDEGKLLADELGLRLLPSYIFDENVTKYTRFWELKQIFGKIGERYVLNDDAGGGKFYFARENMPNRLALFVIENDANSQRAWKNAMEFVSRTGGKVSLDIFNLKEESAKSLNIKSAPAFLINNHIKLSGVQTANSLKENFCKLNDLEVCKLELSNSLK